MQTDVIWAFLFKPVPLHLLWKLLKGRAERFNPAFTETTAWVIIRIALGGNFINLVLSRAFPEDPLCSVLASRPEC